MFAHNKHSLSKIYFITENKKPPLENKGRQNFRGSTLFAPDFSNQSGISWPLCNGSPRRAYAKIASHTLKGGIPSAYPGALPANARPLCRDKFAERLPYQRFKMIFTIITYDTTALPSCQSSILTLNLIFLCERVLKCIVFP